MRARTLCIAWLLAAMGLSALHAVDDPGDRCARLGSRARCPRPREDGCAGASSDRTVARGGESVEPEAPVRRRAGRTRTAATRHPAGRRAGFRGGGRGRKRSRSLPVRATSLPAVCRLAQAAEMSRADAIDECVETPGVSKPPRRARDTRSGGAPGSGATGYAERAGRGDPRLPLEVAAEPIRRTVATTGLPPAHARARTRGRVSHLL
jgi:hypothetical protein